MFNAPTGWFLRPRIAIVTPMAITAVAALSGLPSASASVSQQRHVTAWVSIGGCQASQNTAAPSLEDFKATVAVAPNCTQGESTANAAQQSHLALTRFFSTGSAYFDATAWPSVVHALGRSRFDINFELRSPRSYRLIGEISATRSGPNPQMAQFVHTVVTLSRSGQTIFTAEAEPPQNQSHTIVLNQSGVLEAGTYRILINSDAFVDHFFNNTFADGTATHDVKLTLGPVVPGDVNGDGVVNVTDLLITLNAWGICPAPLNPCDGDIFPHGGDGVVNVNDLLEIISNWSAW